ncbi:hypothetical protein [Bifidobacterium parmae]|uniref:Uncharacterized protein n=1 Tax=Bifidobacterium parmae TaxID=361854 RepID=A0A2N5J3S9_9BIFI|nr:hypothetical protein [Bifidobacterium parmae]PLS28881.1 hypothetical protein Uis4E_1024 [Bifidobacterium parmae]
MFGHDTHLPATARTLMRSTLAFCTAVALCAAAPSAASAIDRIGTLPVTTLRDASCLSDDPIALTSAPGGQFLFAIDKGGAVCRIRITDLSADGTAQVDGGFATSRPHVEFTPDGATMLVNGRNGVAAIGVDDLATTLHPSTGSDYMLSPDGERIGVIERDDTGGTGTSRSWTLRTFAAAGGENVAAVPLRYADDAGTNAGTGVIRDVTPYTTNSAGTVWFVGVDDTDGSGDTGGGSDTDDDAAAGQSLRLMAVDVATGVMDDIADDVSPTVYATGTADRHALYVGTADSRVLAIDVDAYEPGSDSDAGSDSVSDSSGTTVVRTMFERHLPIDRILLAPNGARLLVGMTNGRLVVDEGTMQWLDAGDLVSAINPDGTLLYSIDRGGDGTGDGSGAANNGTAGDAIALRVNTFDRNDPTVTRTLAFERNDGSDDSGRSGSTFDRAAGWTFSQDGGVWYVLLAPAAGSARPAALLAMDVSPFTTESVSRSTTGDDGRRPLGTTTIAIVVAVAALLIVTIMIVRRRTDW